MNLLNISNKRGISAIVATVLIILITLAAMIILWAAIIPLISERIEKSNLCSIATSQISLPDKGYSCTFEVGGGSLNNKSYVQVKRGAEDVRISNLALIFYKGGVSSKPYGVFKNNNVTNITGGWFTSLPGKNEEVVYMVKGLLLSPADSVSIAPMVKVGRKAKEVTCDIAAVIKLEPCDRFYIPP